jgi:dolichol-phosphate mannosyltransferase
VRAISLSRNFGHQMALTCGYDMAAGDAVICLDADLQDPPEVAAQMIAKWEEGADVVYGVRNRRAGESKFKLWTAAAFYRLFQRFGDSAAPADAGDFRLMSKRGLEAFRQLREQHRYVRGMVGWIGFRTATVAYDRQPRAAGQTKYPLTRMLAFAADALISFSSFPLRLAYVFAFASAALIFGYLLFTLAKYLFLGQELVRGWTSLILAIAVFGFATLFSLGIIGEYIGRIYVQTKNRPLYLVREMIERRQSQDETKPFNT